MFFACVCVCLLSLLSLSVLAALNNRELGTRTVGHLKRAKQNLCNQKQRATNPKASHHQWNCINVRVFGPKR